MLSEGNDGHIGATVEGVKMLLYYSSNDCAWNSELSVLSLFQRYTDGIKTPKQLLIENYKLEIKKQLFKNQLSRNSIMITKQNDFFNRTLKQSDEMYKKERIQNDLKFKIVAQSSKYKIDKINKFNKQCDQKIPKNDILHTIHKQINDIYNKINFYHRSESDQTTDKQIHDMTQDFNNIYKDLLDSSYNNT